MEAKTARIYYIPPRENRGNQILRAKSLLETHGFVVKLVESNKLSPTDRHALSQSGFTYPVAYVLGKYISVENLESELNKEKSAPPPQVAPPKVIEPLNEFLLGVSPPGPPSIWMDNMNESPSPRRSMPSRMGDPLDEEPTRAIPNGRRPHMPMDDPFAPFGEADAGLEEIQDDDHDMHEENPAAAPSAPSPISSSPASPPQHIQHSPPNTSESDLHPPQYGTPPSSSAPSTSPPRAKHSTQVPAEQLDPRTQKMVWLFNSIKDYCETAEFKRSVNLLGQTASMVETGAKSVWSYFGWGSSPAPASSQASEDGMEDGDSNREKFQGAEGGSDIPTPPPDTDRTLTLLVVQHNWYGRDQYRFVKFEASSFVRLRTDTLEERERVSYESVVAVRLAGPIIKFNYTIGNVNKDIAYNFGDAELARMITEALSFLKGAGSLTISYQGH